MTQEPVEKYFGTPLSEWLERAPNELEVDAVSLWQIVGTGDDGFGLKDEELKDFVTKYIVALVKRGAVPVVPSRNDYMGWKKQDQYGHDPEEIAANVINEWQKSGKEPNHDGLWFFLF